MKKFNYFVFVLIIAMLIFIAFSSILYSNIKSDTIKNSIINDNLTLSSMGPSIEADVSAYLDSIDDSLKLQSNALYVYADSDYVNDFYRSNCLFMDLDSIKIFRFGNDSIYVMSKDVFDKIMPCIKAYTFKMFVLSYSQQFGENEEYSPFSALDIKRKYGYFRTGKQLVSFRNYNYKGKLYSIYLTRSMESITKELSDFAVLIGVIFIIAGIISAIFVMLFLKANEKAVKIEERSKRQIEFIRLNKLLGIEQLSESIIHNINTPLTSIKGFLQVLHQRESDISVKYKIPILLSKLDSIIEQVSTILLKTRQDMSDKITDLEIGVIVDYIMTLKASHIQSSNIRSTVNIEVGMPLVRGVHGDFSMIIENFIDNAIDSMFESEKKILTVNARKENQNIVISVTDTGSGIEDSVKDKIFDLYFTTKMQSSRASTPKGTGIGLYSVDIAAKRNNWRISVDSKYGSGSTFSLIIPLCSEEE